VCVCVWACVLVGRKEGGGAHRVCACVCVRVMCMCECVNGKVSVFIKGKGKEEFGIACVCVCMRVCVYACVCEKDGRVISHMCTHIHTHTCRKSWASNLCM